MRLKYLLLILLTAISFQLSAQQLVDTSMAPFTPVTIQNKHYITSWSQLGSYDTVIVKSSTVMQGSFLGSVGGTQAHPWVIVNEGGSVYINGGLDNYDVHNIVLLGYGAPNVYGFIFNAQSAGFALPLKGKSHHIKFYGVQLNGGTQEGFTAKIEASDFMSYHCDTSVAHFVQNNIYYENCKVRFNGGEAWYINSSGWYARDLATCPIGNQNTFEYNDNADVINNQTTTVNKIYVDPTISTRYVQFSNKINKSSGTLSGKIYLQGSADGNTYLPVDSQNLVNASQTYLFTLQNRAYDYYKIIVSSTATVSAKLNSYASFYFYPPPSDSITITKCVSIAPGRSAVNFNNLSNGVFTFNKLWHLGRELNPSQGRALAGAKMRKKTIITDNKVFGSYQNNFWIYGEDTIDFERNYGDSADFYATTPNPQQNAAVQFGVSDSRKTIPTTWIIESNEFYHGSGGGGTIQYILYPGPAMTNANVICNNIGNLVIDKSQPLIYSSNCSSTNKPPIVNAGNDTTITQPASTINLKGIATDLDGSIASTLWSNGDGCTIASASSLNTTATCTTVGDHIFSFTCTDNNGASSTAQKKATVIAAANTPPVAVAQNDTVVYEPIDTLLLHQAGTDADGSITAYSTTLLSSYFPIVINNANTITPSVVGLVAGDTIRTRLKVTDNNGASAYDTTVIIVKDLLINHAPVPQINRDTSQEYRQPIGEIGIDASSSYDPDKGDYVASYLWKQTAGDTNIVMNGKTASVLFLQGLDTGIYKFSLTVKDKYGKDSTLNFQIKGLMSLRFKIITGKSHTPAFLPVYGGLWANYNAPQKIAATKLFAMKENRVAVNFPTWNGMNSPIAKMVIDSGQLASLNIVEADYSPTTQFSSVNLTTYRNNVTTLSNNVNIDSTLFVQGNEGNSTAYHQINDSTDMAPNITMASIVARAALAKGIKSADGGITSEAATFATYRYLSLTHDADTTDFLHYCVPVNRWNQLVNRNNSDVEKAIANVFYLERRYDTIAFTYANVHLYFPLAKRMNDTATNWRADYTGIAQVSKMIDGLRHGKDKMTNEFGVVNADANVLSYVIADFKKYNYKRQTIWNDYTSSKVSPVLNGALQFTALGNNLKLYIQ